MILARGPRVALRRLRAEDLPEDGFLYARVREA
jgi:hypothetical protein